MYYIGVDLGGTNIAVGLLNKQGDILKQISIPTLRERKDTVILKDLASACLKIIEGYNIEDVDSIGIGSPGISDSENGIIKYSNNLNFLNTHVRNEVRKYIDLPVFLDNDANCAAYGESIKGACKDTKNSITVTLGTGIGGGVIVNGKILRGTFGAGGELGHHTIIMNGEKCSCGRLGCWEAYGSATALIRDTKIAAIKNPNSLLNKKINGDFDIVNAKFVFDTADEGDETSKEVVNNYIDYISLGLSNVINIFDPEIVAIGGGVSYQGEKILKPIRDNVSKLSYGGNFKTKIVSAILGNDAGIIGAAFLSKQI